MKITLFLLIKCKVTSTQFSQCTFLTLNITLTKWIEDDCETRILSFVR